VFHFIKSLEKEVYAAAVLVLVIIGLTTEGFGGAGRDAMTAMAETPAVLPKKDGGDAPAVEESADVWETGKDVPDLAGGEGSGEAGKEDTVNIEYGRQVVGYLLARDINQQREAKVKEAPPSGGEEETGDGLPLNQQDYQVLLKIVEAEAGICDDKGKILVANVILNRVKSDEFPDSVTDVVYQPSQFSPVSNGSINTCKVSSETVESVNRALKGEDYSQGALFFMNRAAARSGSVRWFDGRLTYLFGHQGHEFFK